MMIMKKMIKLFDPSIDQAEKNWVPPSEGESVAIPQESTNFVRKKIKAPVSKEKTSIYLEVTNVS